MQLFGVVCSCVPAYSMLLYIYGKISEESPVVRPDHFILKMLKVMTRIISCINVQDERVDRQLGANPSLSSHSIVGTIKYFQSMKLQG